MTDSDERDNLGFSRYNNSRNTVVCNTLTKSVNSSLSCPLVERLEKSENVSLYIVHEILAGESLTMILKIKGKFPATKRIENSQKLT